MKKKSPASKVALTKAPKKTKAAEPVKDSEEVSMKPSEIAARGYAGTKGTPLESLKGIKPKDLQSLHDLGINSVEDLAKEDLKNISKLRKLSQKQLKTWVDTLK